jgi:hypothetical protein
MSWHKTDVKGKVTWESCDGERLRQPEESPKDLYGWHKVNVEGRIMWESPDGAERVFKN